MNKRELELYIHIPFCARKCAYCDFLSFAAPERVYRDYMDKLMEEICGQGPNFQEYRVSTIFVGGGTPSLLPADLIMELFATLHENFDISLDAEITMEANPGTLTMEKLEVYRQSGVNRLSIGLQSADDKELKYLGRIHSYDSFLKSYQRARQAGFQNINIDLMFAIPGQSYEGWIQNLRTVAKLGPEHISAYSLIIEDGTPFGEKYGSEEGRKLLPDEDSEREMYHETKRFLRECGYERYEISNYAKPGRECRHNIGYWTGVPYLGLGLGASSYMNGSRFAVSSDMQQYLEEKPGTFTDVEKLTKKDMEEEFFYVGLRMTAGVSLPEFERRFGVSAKDVYPGLMEMFVEEKAAVFQGDRFVLTDYGLDVSNYIMAQFLQG